MKFNWMKFGKIMTEVDATDMKNIKIRNLTRDSMDTAFGHNKIITEEDIWKLFTKRIFPETRENAKDILREMNIPYYEPYMVVRQTKGITPDDFYWINFCDENLDWETQIKPMRDEDRIWSNEELNIKRKGDY